MRDTEFPVTFQPLGKTVYVLEGTRLTEAAADAGAVLDFPCGGEGTCGKCRVVVRQGDGPANAAEQRKIAPQDLVAGVRLACQTQVHGPMVVEIPVTSLLAASYQILAKTESLAESANGTLALDAGRAATDSLAVAVDVGTTTVVAMLLDMATGQELAVAARLNPQTASGDDVLTRILYVRENAQGHVELQRTILAAADEMIGELVQQAGVARHRIFQIALAGNTTMQQLLLGLDTRALGEVPFAPATLQAMQLPASALGLHIHPLGQAYVLPVIGGFVGGDTVSGILATGLTDTPGPTLLVDIGTNGEIVLWAHGKLTAASTAAGPAFEGARISCGMRGAAGAIEKVVVDGHLRINVIGNVPPLGLCGSALVDLAAELLRHGLLSPEGRLRPPRELPEGVLPDLRQRVVVEGGKTAFVLASAEESGTGRAIQITQRDLRELQLASGAIRAGIVILLRRAGLEPADLAAVFVAGGFGNFIRRSNAQRIGLLPEQIERHHIRYRGNTSLAGARVVAVSQTARCLAEDLARRTEHVDLSSDSDFAGTFAEAMLFPRED